MGSSKILLQEVFSERNHNNNHNNNLVSEDNQSKALASLEPNHLLALEACNLEAHFLVNKMLNQLVDLTNLLG